MRNRKLQRQRKKMLENGVAAEDILVITEQRLKRTSEYGGKYGSIIDETPRLATKPGKRLIIRRNPISLKGDNR